MNFRVARPGRCGSGRKRRLGIEPLESRQLLAVGALDTNFSSDGKISFDFVSGSNGGVRSVAVQSDGKILMAGWRNFSSGDDDFAVARFHPDGTLDISFDGDGIRTIPFDLGNSGLRVDQAQSVKIRSNGKIVLGGYAQRTANDYDFALVQLNSDGSLDSTFGTGGKVTFGPNLGVRNDKIFAIEIQSDGKIVAVGEASNPAGSFQAVVTRFNSNGSVDTAFGGAGTGYRFISFDDDGSTQASAAAVALQSNGRIVVVGTSIFNGNADVGVARLNTNGTLDTTFGISPVGGQRDGTMTFGVDLGTSKLELGTGVGILSSGKIMVGGTVSTGTSAGTDFLLARLNTNGTLDTTFNGSGLTSEGFNLGSPRNDLALGMVVQPDGKVIMAGGADASSTTSRMAVVRFTTSGALDTTFNGTGKINVNVNSGFNVASGIALAPNGDVIVGGYSESGTTNKSIAIRLVGDSPNSSTVTLHGTEGADQFVVNYSSPTSFSVRINAETRFYNTSTVSQININGRGGADTAIVTLPTTGANTIVLNPTSGSITRSGSMVTLSDMEKKYVYGRAADSATLFDSSGDDVFGSLPQYSILYGPNYVSQVIGVGSAWGRSTSGGEDTALLYDSDGNNTFVARPREGEITGAGVSLRATGWKNTYGYAVFGGADTAQLFDSDADDVFVGLPSYSILSSNAYAIGAVGFDIVSGFASEGLDSAVLFDSGGDDVFTGTPLQSTLVVTGNANQVNSFEQVFAFASLGDDLASLIDSIGNDVFYGIPTQSTLYSAGFLYQVTAFRTVEATAFNGGIDVGVLNDSQENDSLIARLNEVILSGTTYSQKLSAFDAIYFTATQGNDSVVFHDSAGNDFVEAADSTASILYGSGVFVQVNQIDSVNAIRSSGNDSKKIAAIDFLYSDNGGWTSA